MIVGETPQELKAFPQQFRFSHLASQTSLLPSHTSHLKLRTSHHTPQYSGLKHPNLPLQTSMSLFTQQNPTPHTPHVTPRHAISQTAFLKQKTGKLARI